MTSVSSDARAGFAAPTDQSLIDELRPKLRGQLILPTDAAYDETRTIWNAMIDRRPVMIVRALGVADVVTCVNFARTHQIPLSIRGGGHNIAGLALCDAGLLLDMSLMRGVFVDPVARTARAQAGCLLGDVDRETQLHGLAAVLGFVSNTGIAGLTVGGGFGYLTRQYGWTCDNVISMDVVTADGKLVRASERENADLFWALRGGGGNFGVVTSFEYKLYPVGPEIIGGAIAWRAEDAPEVLEMYRDVMRHASPELAVIAALRLAPPAPWMAKEVHGKPIVAMFVCHSGSIADGEKAAARIKGFGKPVGDVVIRRPYVGQQSIVDAVNPKGRRYYWKSEYLPELSARTCNSAIAHGLTIPSPHSAILCFPLDGALNRLPADHSPAGNRDARFVLNIASSWEKREDDATNIEWTRAVWRDMRKYSTGGTYVNFLTEEEQDDRLQAAYGTSLGRLAEVKAKWDPANFFRVNKNIAPA